ncbi:BTB/POZ and MATH domain-containing protein 3 [Carex littledalei]|uniref:BTB/POZ and MATH domain-containing protein 3 n=1 Tax=Carex littledalei TaxID=544730 RepID=A0A833VKI4_9POAL|nr:BTB/POZ and MATH domain-containing protein 3 [Carex littledalei]
MSNSAQNPVKTLATTGCVRRMEQVTRTHMFQIMGYSLDKHIAKGKFLESTIFEVGGSNWSIQYYPNGRLAAEDDDDIYRYFFALKTNYIVQ